MMKNSTRTKSKTLNPFSKNSPLNNQDGIAMVAALLFLVVLALLSVVATNKSATDAKRTEVFKESKDVFYIADAGIEHAKLALKTANLDTVLAAGGILDLDGPGDATVSFNNGSYSVVISDNDDGDSNTSNDSDDIVNITSTGTSAEGTTKVISAFVMQSSSFWSPNGAILTDGDLDVSGNMTVTSNSGNGGVHTNDDVSISGNPIIADNVSASDKANNGNVGECSGNVVNGSCSANQDEQTFPDVNPTDYEQYADYKLGSDGKVRNSSNTVIASVDGCCWNGWEWSSGQWVVPGSSFINGMFYVSGDVKISGNPGETGELWKASIVTTGNIEISGNPGFENYENSNDPEGVQNLFLIAEKDIKLSGNFRQTSIEGIIVAGEQIDVSGNPIVSGFILAEDECDLDVSGCTDSELVKEENSISGKMQLTNNGTTTSPFSIGDKTVSVVSWNG
ncbi:MAG: hypothetical protein VYC17_04660 [Nitrospinota bacterium]|nr:hypothetical protein [Nitrospinota bacterium]